MLKFLLSKNAAKAVKAVVGDIFARAKKRLFGRDISGGSKDIRFNVITRPADYRADLSLRGIFDAAARAEGMPPNEKLYASLEKGVEDYLDAHQKLAEARVLNAVQSYMHDADHGSSVADPDKVLKSVLEDAFGKTTDDVGKVVDTEATKVRNYSTLDAIGKLNAAIGIEDPTVYFAGPVDGNTCKECLRLFFLEDKITPRVWKVSELKNGYFKRGGSCPCVGGLHPHCFTGDMRLACDRGLVKFKELVGTGGLDLTVDSRAKKRAKRGLWLDRHTSGSRQLYSEFGVFSTGKLPCVKITVEGGQFIEVSKDHEMWVDDNSMGVRVLAKDVKIGDKIPMLSGETSFGPDHFPIEAELMGNLLGDGYILKGWAHWVFFGNDIPYGESLLQLTKTLEVGRGLVNNGQDALTIYKPDNVYRCERSTFGSKVIGGYLIKEFGFSKDPRRVPERVWKGDRDTVAAFLRGLYAADGHVDSQCSIALSQNDRIFIGEIQTLLSEFGIVARIYEHGQECTKKFGRQDGTERTVEFKPCWRLKFGGAAQLEKFRDEIGFGVPAKNERVQQRIDEFGKNRHGSWRTCRVVSVEDIGERDTYCLNEPETNTVSVNGIVTGQCRHALVSVLRGYGFVGGALTYIEPGYDVYAAQRK